MTEIGPDEPAGGGLTRREALSLAAVPLVVAAGVGADELIGSEEDGRRRRRRRLKATPQCDDGPTDPQTEGPFFAPDSPRRRNLLVSGVEGTTLVLSGRVMSRSCRPIAGALLDFWQADAAGRYDNDGFRLRGHQFSDGRGRYRLTTVVPGLYPGRTRHIHVKVRRRGPVLTTQLYFPGTAGNEADPLFHRDLLIAVRRTDGGRRGHFTFVLD